MESKRRPLVIAGSGRSGTTWVQDVIAEANQWHTVFEPLLPVLGDIPARYAGRYLPESAEAPELLELMSRVLSGQFNNVWTSYRVRPDRLWPGLGVLGSRSRLGALVRRYRQLFNNMSRYNRGESKGLAVKFIRANLMLDWLDANYDIDILFVVRHPCAVIESKLRLDQVARDTGLVDGESDWDPFSLLGQYVQDKAFMHDYFGGFWRQLEGKALSAVEAHAVIWCLENGPVLRKGACPHRSLACYESIVISGDQEWSRICRELGIENLVTQTLMERPSQQASQDFKALRSIEDKLSRWRERMGEADREKVQSILNLFEIDIYSAFEPMPVRGFDTVKHYD